MDERWPCHLLFPLGGSCFTSGFCFHTCAMEPQHSTAVRSNWTRRTKRQVSSPRTSATGQTQGQSSHGSVLAVTHVCCALQTRECLGPGLSAHSVFQQLERLRLPGAPGKRPLINRCHETREVLSDHLGQDRFSIVTKPAK